MKTEEKTAIIAMAIYNSYEALPPGYSMVSIERFKGSFLYQIDLNWIEYIIKDLSGRNLIEYVASSSDLEGKISFGIVVKPDFLVWYKNYSTKHKSIFNSLKTYPETTHNVSVLPIADDDNKYSFEQITNTLTVGNKQIKFKNDTRKLLLLKLLLKSPSGIYYAEVVEKLEGATTNTVNTKNICYEACRGIEISLSKMGVTNFLQFDYNQVKINPEYKRASK